MPELCLTSSLDYADIAVSMVQAILSEDRTADGERNQQEGRPQAKRTATLHLDYVNAIFLYKMFFLAAEPWRRNILASHNCEVIMPLR